MRFRPLFLVAAMAVLSTAGLLAQQPAAPPAQPMPDISGIWNRLDTSGGGSYGGISAQFPRAQLHPEFAARLPAEGFQGIGAPPPGVAIPIYDIASSAEPAPRCAVGGGPGTGNTSSTINSAGMSLIASKDVVLMLRDGAHGGRYMFTDGRPFPSRFAGPYTIGRWENGAFVARTRGFGPGQTGFGRGWTEASTELTETFRLSPDGQRLTITYEWNDPKIYVKPLVYDIVFERLPADQQIWENSCDARNWIEENRKGTLKPRPEAP